jgi:hypothetical protein
MSKKKRYWIQPPPRPKRPAHQPGSMVRMSRPLIPSTKYGWPSSYDLEKAFKSEKSQDLKRQRLADRTNLTDVIKYRIRLLLDTLKNIDIDKLIDKKIRYGEPISSKIKYKEGYYDDLSFVQSIVDFINGERQRILYNRDYPKTSPRPYGRRRMIDSFIMKRCNEIWKKY